MLTGKNSLPPSKYVNIKLNYISNNRGVQGPSNNVNIGRNQRAKISTFEAILGEKYVIKSVGKRGNLKKRIA